MIRNILKYAAFSNPGTLEDYEAHLWAVDLDQYECLEYGDQLPPSERGRASRFHFDIHMNRFIKKHVILRFLLGNYLGKDFYGDEFAYGSNGKPYLSEKYKSEDIYFNISQSDSIGLFGFLKKHGIGVDVERIKRIPERENIVENYFSNYEKHLYFSALPEEADRTFFQIWTEKEAYLKMLGSGLEPEALKKYDRMDPKIKQIIKGNELISFKYDGSTTTANFKIMNNFSAAVAIRCGISDFMFRLNRFIA